MARSGTTPEGDRFVELFFSELLDQPATGMNLMEAAYEGVTGATVLGVLAWRAAGLAGRPPAGNWVTSLNGMGLVTVEYRQ